MGKYVKKQPDSKINSSGVYKLTWPKVYLGQIGKSL